MKSVEESRLVFEFDETKSKFIKFDKNVAYKKVSGNLKPTRGVDFIFLFNEERLVFIEVKNFNDHTKDPETKEKFKNNAEELVNEIALKVRDTLACGFASARFSTHDAKFWKTFVTTFISEKPVFVVAWIEFDGFNSKEKKVKMQIWNSKLKQKLHWIQSVKTSINNIDNPLSKNIVDMDARVIGH